MNMNMPVVLGGAGAVREVWLSMMEDAGCCLKCASEWLCWELCMSGVNRCGTHDLCAPCLLFIRLFGPCTPAELACAASKSWRSRFLMPHCCRWNAYAPLALTAAPQHIAEAMEWGGGAGEVLGALEEKLDPSR